MPELMQLAADLPAGLAARAQRVRVGLRREERQRLLRIARAVVEAHAAPRGGF